MRDCFLNRLISLARRTALAFRPIAAAAPTARVAVTPPTATATASSTAPPSPGEPGGWWVGSARTCPSPPAPAPYSNRSAVSGTDGTTRPRIDPHRPCSSSSSSDILPTLVPPTSLRRTGTLPRRRQGHGTGTPRPRGTRCSPRRRQGET